MKTYRIVKMSPPDPDIWMWLVVDENNHVRGGADTEREAKNLAREFADTADG